MILDNPAPELQRLRAALRIEWPDYRAWIDRNIDAVNLLAELSEANGEEPSAMVRAQYIHETWTAKP